MGKEPSVNGGIAAAIETAKKKDPLRRERPYSVSVMGGRRYYQQ